MSDKKPSKETWSKIKKEYITGNGNMSELGRKYGLAKSTISMRSTKEGWTEQRKDYLDRLERAAEEVKIQNARTNAEAAQEIVRCLMQKLAAAAQLVDAQDTGAMRQITQCVKDLQEMEVFSVRDKSESGVQITLASDMKDYGG